MRFLVHELGYESPLAAGRYHYLSNGTPTGAAEAWRFTEAVDGYRILRVDLDARAAPSGNSYLYHLTLNPSGAPERLNFRVFGPGKTVRGNVLFEDERATLSREVNGERRDAEVDLEAGAVFWFPSAAGLSLLAALSVQVHNVPALTLQQQADFDLWPTRLTLQGKVPERLEIGRHHYLTQAVAVSWADQSRTVWLDEDRWPVKVQRGDLIAVEEQRVRYTPKVDASDSRER